MGWFIAQSFVLLGLSFMLGLAVGYLWWVSRLRRVRATSRAPAADAPSARLPADAATPEADATIEAEADLRRRLADAETELERQRRVAVALRGHHDLDLAVIARLTQERDSARARLASLLELPVSEVA